MHEGETGKAIATIIETALVECPLDSNKIRGQAYDGASNMSGKYKGCMRVQQLFAIYSHCCSDALNLAEVSACSLTQVNNLFGVVCKVYKFFHNHPKRHYINT